jgi:hypothetical protein
MKNLLTIISLSLAVACNPSEPLTPNDGSDEPGANASGGCDITILPIDSDDSVLGFSADDILSFAESYFPANLIWAVDESYVPFDINVSYNGGAIELIDQEPIPSTGSNGSPAEIVCTDSLSIEVEISFSTPDGTFNETATTNLSVQSADQANFYLQYDEDSFAGTYVFDLADTSTYDTFGIVVTGSLELYQSTGQIQGRGEWESGSVAGLDSYSIASWIVADID